MLTWFPNSPNLNPIARLWDVQEKQGLNHGDPSPQLTGFKGSATDGLVPDTTAGLVVPMPQVRTVSVAKVGPTQNLVFGHKVMTDRCMSYTILK